jgi:opacity protein-like surface antigen
MKRLTLAGLLAGLFPVVSSAEMTYSNVEFRYLDFSLDRPYANLDGNGFAIGGAYELNKRVFLLGEWQHQNYDFGVDGRQYEFGAGYHHPIDRKLDFVGTLTYVDNKIDVGPGSVSDDALGLGAGVRIRLISSFELDAMLKYVDFDKAGSDTGARLDGRWYFKRRMAFTFGTDTTNDVDALHLGFRAEF